MINPLQNAGAKKVVIIGGGFAGINLAQKLAGDPGYVVTLVDKNNYNFFPPLLYQVATGFLEISNISYPFRKLFRKKKNLLFRLGSFTSFNPATHTCTLDNGEIMYDHLVFATGAVSNFFGNANIERDAIPMKTVNDALAMRNVLLERLEEAGITDDPCKQLQLLTIVVAGGGPTGVEVAGMLAELRKYILAKDYPALKDLNPPIYLVEGAPKLLAQMSWQSYKKTSQVLERLGVQIKLNTLVKDFVQNEVILTSGEIIRSNNLIWAAGIIAQELPGMPASCIGKGKRVLVDEYNAVIGLEDVFAIGDTCLQTHDVNFPAGHPQLAQVAIQQGRTLAGNLLSITHNRRLQPFAYSDKGTMAIAGRNNAVCDLFKGKVHISGFPALVIWLLVHLLSLISYPNKLKTLFNWTVAYITKDQSLRMIIGKRESANGNRQTGISQ